MLGGLIQSGAQGDAAAFAHFNFAAPLATFAHPGIHAGIGQQGMEGTVAREAAQITQFGSEPQPPQGQDLEEIAGLSFARGSHFLEPFRSRGES